MANNAFILLQAFDIRFGEGGDPVEIEPVKGRAEDLPLGEDRAPAQTRLEAFEA